MDVTTEQDAGVVGLVLDLDPDLGIGIAGDDWELARNACRGRVITVEPGVWDTVSATRRPADAVGILIVSGLVAREVTLRDRHMFELLGAGDVVHPHPVSEWPHLAGETTTTAITETLVVSLEAQFVRVAARWPSLLGAVQRRLEAQRERLAVQGLIAHLPRAEHRLLLQLWHLAGRWGRVTPDGIIVPLQLTHDLLGQLIAARRPTVTLAVRALEQEGLLQRLNDGTLMLTAASENMVRAITRTSGPTNSIGETLMLRQRSGDLIGESQALRAKARQTRVQRRRAAQLRSDGLQ